MHKTMYLPCGGEANFDHSSGISYRCEMCNAVIGSVGMPRNCQTEMSKWWAYEAAGMWQWDYDQGRPQEIVK
jgi:hypothetical protein